MRRTAVLLFFVCNRQAVATPTQGDAGAPMTRCSAGQLNTPCVFQRGAECFVRHANCTELPCTEAPPDRVDCGVFARARAATACDVVVKCRGATCPPIAPACEAPILAATACSKLPACAK